MSIGGEKLRAAAGHGKKAVKPSAESLVTAILPAEVASAGRRS